ncbi:hypothetical protein KDA23_07170 [Candidatus Saccharibacteria bacterium]|nr:hypothetical protein [Candidatus Saccharibacteria bacterium]
MSDNDADKQAKRPIGFVALGIALLAVCGYLVYDAQQQKSTLAPTPSAYRYSTTQNVHTTVSYNSNSFFGDGPGASNTAYVAKLTNTVKAMFHYAYRGNKTTQLTYRYDVTATVKNIHATGGDSEKTSNVWNKQFTLLNPITATQTTKSFTVDPIVIIPFASYRTLVDQFRDGLSLPVNSEMITTFTMRVSGKVGGTPFTDTKIASVSAPLDQPVYQLATKYTKTDQQTVLPQTSQRIEDILARYEVVIAIVVGLTGLTAMGYGFRKQIFKSPYQRELDRIYRYYDNIIIRAKRPANLANKNYVSVQSFDDLLNIEEEIKAPIIASPTGVEATQFLITRDDVVYVYTLGDLPARKSSSDQTTSSEPTVHKHPVVKRKVSG